MAKKDKPQGKNLWKKFQNVENTSKGLKKKAEALAPILLSLVRDEVDGNINALKDQEVISGGAQIDEKKFDCVLEYICFFLHFIDRQAWNILRKEKFGESKPGGDFDSEKISPLREKKNLFMDTLVEEIVKVIPDDVDFLSLYTARQEEYSEYKKLAPDKGKGAKDTLFWEFSKKIAEILENSMDIRILMLISSSAFSIVEAIKLPKLIKSES